jgi:hypothetical protein
MADTPLRDNVVLEWSEVRREVVVGGEHDYQIDIARIRLGCHKAAVNDQLDHKPSVPRFIWASTITG